MSVLADTVAWLLDGSHWTGPGSVPQRLAEHVELSAAAVGLACLVALPIGLLLGHLGRGGALAVNISNAGRAIPTFGVLVLLAVAPPPFGIGNLSVVTALTLFAIPPLLTNAYVGMRGVDADAVEAARGMGMTGGQVLRRVEVPLARPLIMAGLRTAAVQVVATATVAALVAGGGLGRFIVDGFAVQDQPQILAGAILVAALSIITEVALGLVERASQPAGSRRRVAAPEVVERGTAAPVAARVAAPVGAAEPPREQVGA